MLWENTSTTSLTKMLWRHKNITTAPKPETGAHLASVERYVCNSVVQCPTNFPYVAMQHFHHLVSDEFVAVEKRDRFFCLVRDLSYKCG